jgi:hypothetical protein
MRRVLSFPSAKVSNFLAIATLGILFTREKTPNFLSTSHPKGESSQSPGPNSTMDVGLKPRLPYSVLQITNP